MGCLIEVLWTAPYAGSIGAVNEAILRSAKRVRLHNPKIEPARTCGIRWDADSSEAPIDERNDALMALA